MADVVVDSDNTNPKELFGQGVRAYVLQDYSAAVSALGKASELLVVEHGDDLHESLGEVYLYYGKSLLGVSREESEPLGDAVPRNEESSEEDNAEETEENETANEENSETANEEDKEPVVDENEDDKEPAVDQKEEDKPLNGTGEGSSNGATKENEETDDEPTDLQLAWEVLELAKKIFQKQGDAAKKNLAETLTVLGEVSLESENFDSAVNDINEGLQIQKELFEKDSRTVAETYYKLGIAYSTTTQIDSAINSFNNSLEYLNNRISTLEKLEDKNKEVEDEIKEIKNLIPEIEEKVADMKTYKDEVCKCDIRTTIRNLLKKEKFPKFVGDNDKINKLEVKRKPIAIEDALNKVTI